MVNWALDPDWCAIAQNVAHPQHHIQIDQEGNYICRECSRTRLYILRTDEVARLLLMDRVPKAVTGAPQITLDEIGCTYEGGDE